MPPWAISPKGLSQLGKKDGVNVNAIHPGVTQTERLEQLLEMRSKASGKTVEQLRAEATAKDGLRRLGQPEDIAALTLFLCSEGARHIQGTPSPSMAARRWLLLDRSMTSMPMAQRAACVIGWPVEHSRSPLIHNYWIRRHGLDAEYRREAVRPEEFAGFVARLAERGYAGANVTLPHKEAALAASEPDDRARAVGAANTLWLEGERLHSTNTDVEGFIGNLDASVAGWDRGLETAIVLGAGGGACAVVFGLIERGVARIEVVNRSMARAQALCRRLGPQVRAAPLGDPGAAPAARRIARQHHIARHEGAGRAGARCDEVAGACRRCRYRVCPAQDAGCSRRRRRAACAPRMGSACCCIRPCAGFRCGSACSRR